MEWLALEQCPLCHAKMKEKRAFRRCSKGCYEIHLNAITQEPVLIYILNQKKEKEDYDCFMIPGETDSLKERLKYLKKTPGYRLKKLF